MDFSEYRRGNRRALPVHKIQDQGIEAVRPRTSGDHYEQHKGIKGLRQIEPVIDPIRFVDGLIKFHSLPPGCRNGNEDDDKQSERGKWCKEPYENRGTASELDQWHPPLIDVDAEPLEFPPSRGLI
jgi:hypothetical protein